MNQTAFFLWTGAVVAVGVCVTLAIVSARIRLPVLGAATSVAVAVGLFGAALGFSPDAPHPVFVALVAIGLFALGVAGGSPLTLFVVGLAESHPVRTGLHGGIVPAPGRDDRHEGVRTADGGSGNDGGREVLRGGATIGYLERVAVMGCLVTGQLEGIALIVAIKGLGRFSELDSPEARERFIIGTLVSLIWACATGALLIIVVHSPTVPGVFGL